MPTQANSPHIFRLFFAFLLGFDSAAVWVIYADLHYNNQIPIQDFWFLALYPLSIGLSAVIIALFFSGNLKALSLKLPQGKFMGEALIYALVFTLAPFLLNLLLHLTGLIKQPSVYTELALLGLPIFLFIAIFEEIMWRGFLYTELSRFLNFPAVCLTIGLISALWHYPVIIHTRLMYSDRPLLFALPMFTIIATSSSFVYCYLRKLSGSIWPCVLLHAGTDWIFYTLIQPMEHAEYTWSPYFMSNIGVLYVLVMLIAGMYFYITGKSGKKI